MIRVCNNSSSRANGVERQGDHGEAEASTPHAARAEPIKVSSRFFWALVCVCWGLVVQGEFGMAQQHDFATWLQELRAEAVALGIRPQTLDAALTGLRPLPRVIELDRKQPEDTLTYAQYWSVPCQRRVCKRLASAQRTPCPAPGDWDEISRAARYHRGALGDETGLWACYGQFFPSSPLWRRSPMTVGAVRCFVVNCWRRSKSSMPAMCVLRP